MYIHECNKKREYSEKVGLTKGFLCILVVLTIWIDSNWRKDKFGAQGFS